jgi:O-antigen/teichoic acid export membrane protein
MNRKKLFITNFLVYGFGGIISKIIPLIMVPIVTMIMPSSFYYGMDDLTNTIISFFSALAVMGMYDAMFRLFFEKKDDDYQKTVCSSAFVFTMITSTVVFALMLIFQKPISQLFYSDSSYGNLVMIAAISVLIGATNSIVSAPTRMQNKKGTFLIMNTIIPIVSYSISIPMLLNGYYLIALPIAGMITSILGEITFGILNHKFFSFKKVNWGYVWSMVKIAVPLMPNFIFYWVFSSSDKVMISNLIGQSQEGIYAVASKFGQISQLIYTAFAGGWQFFAFSIMKDRDNTKVISTVFEMLLLVSLGTTILGTSFCKWGVELLFSEEYWSCYICIPYLYLSPLLLMLYQIGSNQLLVIKKTWPNILFLGVGAGLNIGLNFWLIPLIGIEGASIATFVGYFLSILLMVVALKIKNLMYIRWKTFVAIGLFCVCFAVMRLNALSSYVINIPVAVIYCLIIFLMYFNDYKGYLKSLRGDLRKRKSSVQNSNRQDTNFNDKETK